MQCCHASIHAAKHVAAGESGVCDCCDLIGGEVSVRQQVGMGSTSQHTCVHVLKTNKSCEGASSNQRDVIEGKIPAS